MLRLGAEFLLTASCCVFAMRTAGVDDSGEVPYELPLEFPKLTPEECATAVAAGPTAGQVIVTKQLVLGSVARGAGKEASPVAFEVVIPPAFATLFGVDTAKGSVPPGGSQKVRPACLHGGFSGLHYKS